MGVLTRRRIKENLNQVDVFVDDLKNDYFKVLDIPDTFTQGRSAFKIFGSTLLKNSVPLKIEILDKIGRPVYVQPVKYGQVTPNLPYRYVSVEVYPRPINEPGEAQLVILGELEETEVPFDIPDRFLNTYNVKYTRNVNIDTSTIKNTQPILFYKKPGVVFQEVVKAQRKTNPPSNRFISGSAVLYGKVKTDLKSQPYNTGSAGNTKEDDTSGGGKSERSEGDLKTENNLWKYKSGLYGKRSVLSKRGVQEKRESPEDAQMTLYSINADTFNTKMVGGTIEIPGIDLPASEKRTLSGYTGGGTGAGSQGPDDEAIATMFTFPNYAARVENVISDREITTTKPYSVLYNGPNAPTEGIKYFTDIGSPKITDNLYADFTASYVDWEVPTTSSYRFDSFLDMTIKNMRTFSGDIYRLKIYGASDSSQGDFPVLLETIVESPELLRDTTSPSGFLRNGYFINQTHTDFYWNSYGGDGVDSGLNPVYTMSLADGVYLSGSYTAHNQAGRFELKPDYGFTIEKDTAYTLSFNAKGKRSSKTNIDGNSYKDAKLFFHLSGSNLASDNKLKVQTSGSFGHTITNIDGKRVGLQIDDTNLPKNDGFVNFGYVGHTFTPQFKLDRTTNTDSTLQLRIEAGEWIISDVSLRPAQDTGFSPDEFEVRVPIPPNTQRPDNFDFLIEYFDIDGNTAETVTFMNNIPISGSALVIEGDDNMLSGSLYLGNIQGSGIEIHGGSAFMRSVGYEGFTSASVGGKGGFMIWSGSVLPDAPETYTGAGLEIHDGTITGDQSFFKFRTVDSENDNSSSFEVRSSKFFFGSETAGNFISGALGNLELSSSNFHITPDGDITASNFNLQGGTIQAGVTVLGTVSANQIAVPASGTTLAEITTAGFARFVSASIGGFEVATTQINSVNDSLILKSNGQISASAAQIAGKITAEAGAIGGYSIDATTISSSNDNLILKSSGQITGSTVLFDGGRIAGFDIVGNTLQSTNARMTMSAVAGAEHLSIRNSSGVEKVRIGEISAAASDKYGLKVFDDTNIADNDDGNGQVILLGELGNKIGGWEINDNQIRSVPNAGLGENYSEAETGLILQSRGVIETSDFATGLKGWRISALGNGTAEFENARIRGTLRTTVFEKESINVVGGQLMVANSSTLEPLRDASGSILVGVPSASATDVTMSMANVSGFAAGEILKAKKVDDTGFIVEYLQVTGSQRYTEAGSPYSASIASANMGANDPDGLAGELYVGRGYGEGFATSSIATTLDGGINSSVTSITVDSVAAFGSGSGIDSIYQEIIKIGNERMKVITGSAATKTLQVIRDYHGTEAASHSDGANVQLIDTDIEFLAGLVSTAQPYDEGQVFVSTGKFDAAEEVSSGYILMNANPNDISTPYMDIVERTGSDVYALQLRSRIGDLSGLSSGYLYGEEEPGFGIYTDNGFFRGAITAMTGSIKGRLYVNTSAAEEMILGRDVSGTNDGMFINSNNYWYTTGLMKVGTSDRFMQWDGANLTVQGKIIITSGPAAVQFAALNATTGSQGTAITNAQNKADSGSAQLDTLQTRVEIDNDGMALKNSSGVTLADYSSDITLRGGTITLNGTAGTVGHDRVVLSSADLGIFTNNTRRLHITDDAVAIGRNGTTNISTGTTDLVTRITSEGMRVFYDSNNLSFVSSSGMSVFAGGAEVAQFAAVSRLGDPANEHILLSSAGMTVKDGGTTKAVFGTDAVIGEVDTNKRNVLIDADDGISIRSNTTVLAKFDGDITLGEVDSNKRNVFIDENVGVKIRNNVTDIASFGSDITLVGGTMSLNDGTRNRLVISSTAITMTDEAGNNLIVVEDDSTVPTVTIGETGSNESNVKITNSGIKLRRATTDIITINNDGSITSDDYLIEKSRLFGHGGDGTAVLKDTSCTLVDGGNGIGHRTNNLEILDANGSVVCSRVSSQNGWTMQGDWYVYDLTLDDATGSGRFVTNGYRLFVFGTLTIDANYIISCNGTEGQPGTDKSSSLIGGAGGEGGSGGGSANGTLAPGKTGGDGGNGGAGANGTTGSPTAARGGGGGGGGGGAAGHVLISARKIINNGTIQATGGPGGEGGNSLAN